ncbi:MAG: protein-glutamate O-methyltransferase CheR [Desulfococcaceae bacterium]|nr:protein-glutamate O-methyltransferase CheR [Desulfococcaceae bacterium]
MIKISPGELKMIAGYIYDISGIYLDQSKTYLVETRLKQLVRESGSASYHELCRKAKSDSTSSLESKIIDAICTQETMFFRDNSPFELLKSRILPELIGRKDAQASAFPPGIRIWSAGCSTGQEIYSIAMVLREFLPNPAKYNIRLLGTDISDFAVSAAASGEYSRAAVERGLSEDKLTRYFVQKGEKWKVRDDIRSMCSFRKLNLMKPLNGLGSFDIVFCRNVAIYFQQKDKIMLFNRIADILEPGAYLIIGSSESISGFSSRFEAVSHLNMIYYRLKE